MSNREIFYTKVRRVLRSGFFNFWRNSTVSLASVLVMFIALTVVASLIFGNAVLTTTLDKLRDKVDVNVTFVTTAKESDILSIKHSLESLPEVLLVTYISREDVLTAFKERHQNDQTILSSLEEVGDNPFGATLNVKAKDPSQYASVAKFLQSDNALSSSGLTIIDKINYFQNKEAITKLSSLINSSKRLGFGAMIALALISILISFNTIRLTIYIARDEVAVMRLVGASKAYIQGPFVVVGVIYGLVASLLTLIILLPATYYGSSSGVANALDFNLFSYYLRHFFSIAFLIILAGGVIGSASSLLAIRKYLKV